MPYYFSDDYRRMFKENVEAQDGRTYNEEELEALMVDNVSAMFAGPKMLLPKAATPERDA